MKDTRPFLMKVPREQILRLLPFAGHMRPIYVALLDGLEFMPVAQRTCSDHPIRFTSGKGCVAIIGDDTNCSLGPEGFPGTKHLLREADLTCVHSGAPVPTVYEAAAKAGLAGSHIVLVETQSRHHEVWRRRVQKHAPDAEYLDLRPHFPGGLH